MGRRPGKSKEDKAKEELARLLGIDAPPTTEVAIQAARAKEATIFYVSKPALFTEARCVGCKQKFMVDRANVRFCGEACRRAELLKQGIVWSDEFTKENAPKGVTDKEYVHRRWWGDEPLIVPPGVVAQADAIIDSRNGEAEGPEENIDTSDEAIDPIAETLASVDALLGKLKT
jgi:hypothetical protein